jgi:hypothetical protein
MSRKYALNNLKYSRSFSKSVVEIDEEFEVETTMENNKYLPVSFLQISEDYPSLLSYKQKPLKMINVDEAANVYTMTMLPFQRVKRRYKVSASKRGRYLCKDVTLLVGDLLGLQMYRQPLEFLHEFVVLPQKANLEEAIVSYGDYNGDVSVRRWIIEDPILTVGVRDYTGLEPQKSIHWPSSLKGGRLMVKKFDFTTDNRVMIVLNVETFKPFWMNIDHKRIEKCISMIRTIVEEFEEQGIPYGFWGNGQVMGEIGSDVIMPGWGPNHLGNILEQLGRTDYSITMQFEEIMADLISMYIKYSTYVLVMPFVLESYVEYINRLSEQCEKFILISLDKKNLEYLNPRILTFVERWDEN